MATTLRGFFRFWLLAIQHAFTKGWIAVGAVGTILSVLWPFLRSLDTNAEQHKDFWDIFDKYGFAWVSLAIFCAVVLLRMMWAPYWLYNERREDCVQAKKELSAVSDQLREKREPRLTGKLEQIVTADETAADGAHIAMLLLVNATVRNIGAPSTVEGFQCSLKLGNRQLEVPTQHTKIPEDLFLPAAEPGQPSIRIAGKDALYEKTTRAVESGTFVRGWLFYRVPNLKSVVMRDGYTIRIEFRDVLGSPSEMELVVGASSGASDPLAYLPGAANIFEINPPQRPRNPTLPS
jgi:hypothetical protein